MITTERLVAHVRRFKSPIGDFDVEFLGDAVSRVSLPDTSSADVLTGRDADVLHAFFDGESAGIPVKMDLSSVTSLLQQRVLATLLEIPRGEIRSYAWVAKEVGEPRAVRAVASAIARNPIPLFIPCHRVVRSDGMLGEYSLGGPEVKRRVLAFEGLDCDGVEALARRGVRYVADAAAGTVHVPTCKNAPIDGSNRVELKRLDGAFTACARCRPL